MPVNSPGATTSFYRAVLPIILVSLVLMSPAIVLGHIIGHSSVLNVNWAHGFAEQLGQGIIYPRWLPDMNGGAGSPAFYFYGPLPFYVTAPFTALLDDAARGVVLASTVMLAASGLAAFMLCRLYAARALALLAAALYMSLPYHYAMDIWYRSAFGEQAAFVFMPLMAYCILRMPSDWRFAIGLSLAFSGQLFSHLPTALLFAPVLALLSCWVAWREKSWMLIVQSALAGVGGIGLAAIYLLPAATLQFMIQPDYWRVIVASEHLMLTDKMQEDFSFFLFPQGLVVLLALGLCFLFFNHRGNNSDALVWPVIALGALFFSSLLSSLLWVHAGPFAMVQLPWRLFSVLDLALVVLVAILLERHQLNRRLAYAACAFTVLLGWIVAGGAQYLYYHLPDSPALMTIKNDRDRIAIRADATEYLPACLDLSKADYQAMTYVRIAQNKTVAPKGGVIPVFDYPFLKVLRDGKEIATTCDPQTGFIHYDPALGQAPVQIQKQTLPVELTGLIISLVSLAGLLVAAAFGYTPSLRRRRKA